MGAIVAFEVAHRLQFDNKLTLERLFVSGRRAPSVNREETIHLKDDEGILSEVKTLQGTHEDLLADPDVRRMIIPALRSDYRAIETYAFVESDALNCPITALVGSDDPRVSLDEVRAWNSHTRMGFDLEVFSGGHFFLQEHPVDVIDALRNRLTG
jgi:surfactin synthase thioesterase subunit